ncbi:MAG: hypothetical protein F4Y04_02675 [Chloroflexi bacterium]|nr:hypothetical protein [Chloroflexota bacterium]
MQSSRWAPGTTSDLLILLAIVVLAIVEVLILLPQALTPLFMAGWAEHIDSSKVSVLPPALMAVLLAYANWQNQRYAVKYGGLTALTVAPIVAVRAIPIENFETFALVLFCIGIAGLAVSARHIPHRSLLDWAKVSFFGGFLFLVVPWLMLQTLGSDETPRQVAMVFLGLFVGATVLSVLLFVLDDIRRTVVIVTSVGLAALVLAGIWGAISAFGLDESHPAIANAIVYTALLEATVLLTAYLVLKGNASGGNSEPPESQ